MANPMTTTDVDHTESESTDDGAVRVCALPGCDTPLPPPLDPTQRYCCPAHRKSARKHRRGTAVLAQSRTAPEPDSGPAAPPVERVQHATGNTDTPASNANDLPTGPIAIPPQREESDYSSTWITQPMAAVRDEGAASGSVSGSESQPWWPALEPHRRFRAWRSRTTDPYSSTWAKRRAQRQVRRRVEAAQKAADARDVAAILAGRPLSGEEPKPKKSRGGGTPQAVRRTVAMAPAASRALGSQTSEALVAAVRSLGNNRLRSFLTTIGIIAGVASVIALVAMGDGMSRQFQNQTDKLANQINITPAKGTIPSGGAPRNLTDADITALRDKSRAPHIADISSIITGNIVVTVNQAKDNANLVGVQENYLRLADRRIVAGRWFTETQITGSARVAVIGPQAVNLLFGPKANPRTVIGSPIRLSHSTFTIVGIFDSNGQSDNVVAVPFNAARSYLTGNNGGQVDNVIVKSTNIGTLPKATSEIATILDEQHYIRSVADRDYNINTYTENIRKSQDFYHYLSIFIVAIAAISLFVGGVGVANIMLVSVTERTREIGIRKAVGAKTTAIMRQFLSEAVILTGLGGLAGIGVGIAVTKIAAAVLPHFGAGTPDSQIPIPILSVQTVVVAFVLSLLIGLAAGGYPAHRAARMPPIEALRFE